MGSFHRVDTTTLMRGAARFLIADESQPKPTAISDVIVLTAGNTQYDAMPGWSDLGATREGIQLVNASGDGGFGLTPDGSVVVDQGEPAWGISSRLAEMSFSTLQLVWDGSSIATGASEKVMGVGRTYSASVRRIAIIFKRPTGKLVAVFAHRAAKPGQETGIDLRKGGDPMSLAVRFILLPDPTEAHDHMFFRIHEQI